MNNLKPMVLHFESGRHLYGGALQVLYLMEGLDRQGWENHLVCVQGSEIGNAFRKTIGKVHEVSVAGEMDLRLGVKLLRLIRRLRPAILHVHSRRGADIWGGLAAKISGIPAVITRRVDNAEPSWLAKAKYRWYDRVIAISESVRHILVSEGISPHRISLVHSGVDTRRFKPICDDRWFRREFHLGSRDMVVGVIAQLIPRKGHIHLIEAMPTILASHPNVRFIFLGKGALKTRLEEECRRRSILDRVIFAGFRSDIDRILPCLDLVVHPALMEGLGVSLLQAAACGIPIVASKAGGIPETVRHGENGLLINPGDKATLEAGVLALMGEQDRRRRMGETGRRLVSECFSVPRMVAEYAAIYDRILGKGDRRG